MSDLEKSKRLIGDLLELEEEVVLSQVRERLKGGDDPFEIIEEAQQAMRLVGERYEQGNYYISSMMMAGEIFREVMEILEPKLVNSTSVVTSGKVLMGTVQGDIHDIGKNIFQIILRSHGFSVIDLGVDVSPDTFVEEAIRSEPDIIAFSGLLTVSYDAMREIIHKIKNLDNASVANVPFIIGGGTINEMVCSFVGADYWATDAVVGVQFCRQIMDEKK